MLLGKKDYKLDLMRITAAEYYSLFAPETDVEVEREIMARAWGITVKEYLGLPLPHHQALNVEFFRIARNPVADPNSVSGSTSTLPDNPKADPQN